MYRDFFFSSRRRHTSSLCDWSSDVCSSDLPQREMDSIKSGGPAATTNGQYKMQGCCRNENRAKKKRAAAATRNGQYKKRGAAAARNGQYKMQGRCRNEKWSVKKAGALPQREPGQYKKWGDRKSTRLNSSHTVISYAVFCLKKKKKQLEPPVST